jgi:hypothetical protein
MTVKFAIFTTDFGASIDPWTETELMPNAVDRTLSGASAWSNVDLNAYDETGDLSLTVSAIGQYCTCPVASAPTTAAKKYRLTFDVTGLTGTWTVKSFSGVQTYGTVTASGAQEIQWTATTTGGIRLVSNENNSAGTFDNFSLAQIPVSFIDFEEEPLSGQYDPNAGSYGRGTRITTLGGAVDQDFGQFAQDGKISLSFTDVRLSNTLITALKALFEAIATQYYFTDSVNCWKVKFAKPGGLKVYQNLWYKAAANENVYSVELLLHIDSKDI